MACCPPRPLTVRYDKASASIGVGPPGAAGAQGAPGAPGATGATGPAGDGADPTAGAPGFSADATGVLLDTLTLESGKHYLMVYSGLNYNATLTSGVRSRPFDMSVCVSTLTGSAVAQSQVYGTPRPTTGSGSIEFSFSGLDVEVRLYSTTDTEWKGKLAIDREYDPVSQVEDWYPTDETSCLFCWDPAVGVTLVGSDVSAWLGQVSTVTATAASARPSFIASHAALNNQPAVLFDQASNEKLTVANLAHVASDYQMFAAIDQVSLDSDGYLFDSVTGRLVLASDRAGGSIAYNDGSFKAGNAAAQTGAHYIGWRLDGSGANLASIRKSGANVATGLSYTRVALGGTTKLGSQNSGTTSGLFNGYMGILFGFDSLDAGIRFRAEKYMSARFAL